MCCPRSPRAALGPIKWKVQKGLCPNLEQREGWGLGPLNAHSALSGKLDMDLLFL